MALLIDLFFFALASACVLGAAWQIARHCYPDRPWSRVLAAAIVSVVSIVAILELLGAIGALKPLPVGGLALVLVVATSLLLRSRSHSEVVTPVRWPLPMWATAVLVLFAAAGLAVVLGRPTTGLDTLQYHYPLIAHWREVGDLTTPKTFAIGNYSWYYPSNVNLLYLWSVLWTGSDFLISLVGWSFFGITIAAAAGIARRLGARLITGAAAGLVFAAAPLVVQTQLRSGQVDLAVTAFLALSVFFALAFFQEHRLVDAVFGGAALGLAVGSKIVALPYGGALGALFVVLLIVANRRGKLPTVLALRALGLVVLATAVTGGFWYLRNTVAVGNPLFPAPVLGLEGAWYPLDLSKMDFSVADYILRFNPHPWIVGAWAGIGWTAALLASAGVVATPIVLWVTRARRSVAASVWVCAALVPLLLLGVYLVTPTSAGGPWDYPGLFPSNIRYALPFMFFAVVGLSVALERINPKVPVIGTAAVLVLDVAHLGLSAIGVIPAGGELPSSTVIASLAIGLVATGVGLGIALFIRSRPKLEVQWRRLAAVALVGTVLAGSVSAWYFSHDERFALMSSDPSLAFTTVSRLEKEAGRPLKVAYAALNLNYPLYGDSLQNEVELAAGDAPGLGDVARPFRSDDEFVAFMCSHKPDVFVVRNASLASQVEELEERDFPPEDVARVERNLNLKALEPRETSWADRHPEVFDRVEHADKISVYRVDAQAACDEGASAQK